MHIVDERLILIDKLLISTNLPIQKDIDQAWSDEVGARVLKHAL